MGNRCTGTQSQFTNILVMQQMHLIFQLLVIIQNLLTMLQQQFPRIGQRNFTSLTLEQTSLIISL